MIITIIIIIIIVIIIIIIIIIIVIVIIIILVQSYQVVLFSVSKLSEFCLLLKQHTATI